MKRCLKGFGIKEKSNVDKVEELICSQEDLPGSQYSMRYCLSLRYFEIICAKSIAKKNKLKTFKRVSTPQISEGCRKRRLQRASNLMNRFSSRFALARLVSHNEKDFKLQCLDGILLCALFLSLLLYK